MMTEIKQKFTLDRPATYQIKVPGHLDESWSEWAGGIAITVESEGDGPPVTTLRACLNIPDSFSLVAHTARYGDFRLPERNSSARACLNIQALTGAVDQAALQGLLRRLYSLGLPLISVGCVECD